MSELVQWLGCGRRAEALSHATQKRWSSKRRQGVHLTLGSAHCPTPATQKNRWSPTGHQGVYQTPWQCTLSHACHAKAADPRDAKAHIRRFHAHADTESTCPSTCNLPHSPATSTWRSLRASISSMEKCWWSRRNDLLAGHKVSFVVEDGGYITSWSPGVQTLLGNSKKTDQHRRTQEPEAEDHMKHTDFLQKVSRRCFHFHSFVLSFLVLLPVSLFFVPFPLLQAIWLIYLLIFVRPQTVPLQGRSQVAASSVAASQYIFACVYGNLLLQAADTMSDLCVDALASQRENFIKISANNRKEFWKESWNECRKKCWIGTASKNNSS